MPTRGTGHANNNNLRQKWVGIYIYIWDAHPFSLGISHYNRFSLDHIWLIPPLAGSVDPRREAQLHELQQLLLTEKMNFNLLYAS